MRVLIDGDSNDRWDSADLTKKRKMRSGILLSAFILVMLFNSACNRIYLARGDKHFNDLRYGAAIDNYKKYLAKKDDPGVRLKVAESCLKINQLTAAAEELGKARAGKDAGDNYWLKKGRLLMQMGQYDSAEVAFVKHLEQKPDDKVADQMCFNCSWVSSMMQDTGYFEIRPVNFEGFKNYFSASPYKNGIIFTGFDSEGRPALEANESKPGYDLFYTEKDAEGKWKAPVKLEGEVNGLYHESCACVNTESEQLFFTRGENQLNPEKKDSKLRIMFASNDNNAWKSITDFPYNSEKYSVGHPALSVKQKLFFFVSDMPGGTGGTDIYFSMMTGNGFTEPVNLGNVINTAGNELFPWFNEADSSLYFSSEGHNNFGGLDIFKVKIRDGKPGEVMNLGFPINSSRDDYNYVMNNERNLAMISSNRSGLDKLYEVKIIPPRINLSGIIKEKGSQEPVANVKVEVFEGSSGNLKILKTDEAGYYNLAVDAGKEYKVVASHEKYFNSNPVEVSTRTITRNTNIPLDIALEEIILDKPVVLENLYYQSNEWELNEQSMKELDKLADLLLNNPGIAVEIGSHTDAKADDKFNLRLSEKRAKEAAAYLTKKGVDSQRVSWKGYGETQLLNNCSNSLDCSEQAHSLNRRTEFRVIKIGEKN